MGVKIIYEIYFEKREICPACHSKKSKELYSCEFLEPPIKDYLVTFYSPQGGIEFKYLKNAVYILKECSECSLIYQKEIPNEFLMNKLYEEWIDPNIVFTKFIQDFKRYSKRSSSYAQEIMQLMEYFKNLQRRPKFLDFGMGWGEWCLMAKAFGCDIYGNELSEARIEHAKTLGIKTITWDQIPNLKFDFINTEQVFEHIANPLEVLRHLKKALNKNGLIKISVPNGEDIKRRLQILDWTAPKGSHNSLNDISPLEHINCFNHASIIKMAEKAGIEKVKIPLFNQYLSTTKYKLLIFTFKYLLKQVKDFVFCKKEMGTHLFFRQMKKSNT